MASPSATWTTKAITVTYRSSASPYAKEAGTYTARLSGRIRNTLVGGAKQVFRARTFAAGALDVSVGPPSLTLDVPIIDDPDNSPQGGEIILTITFDSDGSQEVYHLQPLNSWASSTDIADFLTPTLIPATYQYVGVPGGVAALNAAGLVTNADGSTPGTGGSSIANYSEIQALPGYPAVIALGANAAAARSAIGAGTSNLAVGSSGTDAKAGNWTPTVADIPPGSVLFQRQVGGVNPARASARTDIMYIWVTPASAGQPAGMITDLDEWHAY